MTTDGERLWRRISDLGEVGEQEGGGVTRLSLSAEERAAKDRVAMYMEEAGLSVREDAAGNLIGRREGTNPEAPVVLVGSHVDSVYNGGNFDGPLGVLAGIEVLQAMRERDVQDEHPVEVIAFTDEEGARFSFGMIGSRALAGTLTPEDLGEHEDEGGLSIAGAMEAYGLDPARIGEAARPQGSVKAYVELHIEQGRVLESEDLPAGVVTGIAGPVWLRFSLEGETGHAGATPMSLRRDALAAAAEIVVLIEAEASETGTSVGTVGQLDLEPGGINIIPGRVEFSLDLQGYRRGREGRRRGAHPAGRARDLRSPRGGARRRGPAAARARPVLGAGQGSYREVLREDGFPGRCSPERSRARRDAARAAVSDGHDLRPLARWHQPQPRRVELSGGLRGRKRRSILDRARPGRRGRAERGGVGHGDRNLRRPGRRGEWRDRRVAAAPAPPPRGLFPRRGDLPLRIRDPGVFRRPGALPSHADQRHGHARGRGAGAHARDQGGHRRAADPGGERLRVRVAERGRDARLRARRPHRHAARDREDPLRHEGPH